MSCDNWTYYTAILDLISYSSLASGADDHTTPAGANLESDKSLQQGRPELTDRSKSKGPRHEGRSRIIPDSTQKDPEYVWGDEGPIND